VKAIRPRGVPSYLRGLGESFVKNCCCYYSVYFFDAIVLLCLRKVQYSFHSNLETALHQMKCIRSGVQKRKEATAVREAVAKLPKF